MATSIRKVITRRGTEFTRNEKGVIDIYHGIGDPSINDPDAYVVRMSNGVKIEVYDYAEIHYDPAEKTS